MVHHDSVHNTFLTNSGSKIRLCAGRSRYACAYKLRLTTVALTARPRRAPGAAHTSRRPKQMSTPASPPLRWQPRTKSSAATWRDIRHRRRSPRQLGAVMSGAARRLHRSTPARRTSSQRSAHKDENSENPEISPLDCASRSRILKILQKKPSSFVLLATVVTPRDTAL